MKKLIAISLCCLLLFGCRSETITNSPQAAFEQFYQGIIERNIEKMNQSLLSSQPLTEDVQALEFLSHALGKNYQIKSEVVEKRQARLNVEISLVDLQSVYQIANDKMDQAAFYEKFKETPTKVKLVTVYFELEHNQWKLASFFEQNQTFMNEIFLNGEK